MRYDQNQLQNACLRNHCLSTDIIGRAGVSPPSRMAGSITLYLGMTWVVSGQFPRIENIRRGATAKCDREEPKEHHSSTKRAGLHIDTHHPCLEYAGGVNRV